MPIGKIRYRKSAATIKQTNEPPSRRVLRLPEGDYLIERYTLRRTFAARALEAGMDIKVLSSILGHAQASTTLNLYAHALPDHKKRSMEKMGSFYGSALSNNRHTF